MIIRKLSFWVSLIVSQMVMSAHLLMAQHPVFEWAKGIGGHDDHRSEVFIRAIDTDTFGNVYAVGVFTCDSVDFDPGPGVANLQISNNGPYHYDFFVCKFDALGNYVWAKSIVGTESAGVYDISVDNHGFIYFTGRFHGTIDMDPGAGVSTITAVGGSDVYVCKWDTSGALVWAKNMGGFGHDEPRALTTDHDGNVYITGGFQGTADFDPGNGVANLVAVSGYDIFICKLNASGGYEWAKGMGGITYFLEFGHDVVTDDAGNVYFTGVFADAVDFDPGNGTHIMTTSGPMNTNAFVCKLNEQGQFAWARQIGNRMGATESGFGIALDTSGVYVMGIFSNTVDFDPGPGIAPLQSHGGSDIFVCKLDTAGQYVWAGNMGGSEGETGVLGRGITTSNLGSGIYVVFGFTGEADLDPGSTSFNVHAKSRIGEDDGEDYAIVKICPSGSFLWGGTVASYDYEIGMSGDGISGVSVVNGNVYLAGWYEDSVDVDITSDSSFLYAVGTMSGTSSFPVQNVFISKTSDVDTISSVISMDTCMMPFIWNGQTFSESGSYILYLSNVSGCDSLVSLQLTISAMNPEITVDEYVLGTTVSYDSYQWLLNGVPVVGATDSVYTVLENGDYQVVVADGPCMDTSAVYTVNNVGISDRDDFEQKVRIYPNPAQDMVYILSPVPVNITLMSVEGRLIREVEEAKSISISDLAVGVYLLKVKDVHGKGIKIERLIKQK